VYTSLCLKYQQIVDSNIFQCCKLSEHILSGDKKNVHTDTNNDVIVSTSFFTFPVFYWNVFVFDACFRFPSVWFIAPDSKYIFNIIFPEKYKAGKLCVTYVFIKCYMIPHLVWSTVCFHCIFAFNHIWRSYIIVITRGQAKVIAITIMYPMPLFLRGHWLKIDKIYG